jgi:hypothetical protein
MIVHNQSTSGALVTAPTGLGSGPAQLLEKISNPCYIITPIRIAPVAAQRALTVRDGQDIRRRDYEGKDFLFDSAVTH